MLIKRSKNCNNSSARLSSMDIFAPVTVSTAWAGSRLHSRPLALAHNSDKAWFRSEFMVEANTTNSANYANFANGTGDDQFRFREAFVQAGNVLESQPNAKFW